MSPSSSNKWKKESGRKRGWDRVDGKNIATAQQSAKRPRRRGASSGKSVQSAGVETVNPVNATASFISNTFTETYKVINAKSIQSDQLDDSAPTSMFYGNIAISGGNFTQNVNKNLNGSFELLQRRVAPSAFHNSADRFNPPRCHPDTRVEILQSICDWITQSEDREKWLLWLNGAAGAGKSAIMQSIAERCTQAAIAIASFFFFRSDPTRNTTRPLVATLAYQLIQTIPETLNDILLTIERNPLIFDQSIESQLEHLLIQPLLRLPRRLQRLFVVLVDGLDECINRTHQSNLIKLFGSISRGRNGPILFFIASRREPQIEAAFVDRPVSNLLRTLPLDNSNIERTSEDIRCFLADKFQNIVETHLRRHLLPTHWPSASAIEEIVTKSSGQFIYASVVIDYASSPRGNPAHLLEVVRGIRLRDPSSQNPFVHLDALYQHIFSQVEALDKVLHILAFILINPSNSISSIERAFLLGDGELEVCLGDLAAVIKFTPGNVNKVTFLHASLPDFLRDKTRSERYYIDVAEYTSKLSCMFLDRLPLRLDPILQAKNLDIASQARHELYCIRMIRDFLAKGAKASDQLQQTFMTFCVTFYEKSFDGPMVAYATDILKYLKKLNFGDEGRAYCHVMDQFALEFLKHWSLLDSIDQVRVRMSLDLFARISQIHQASKSNSM